MFIVDDAHGVVLFLQMPFSSNAFQCFRRDIIAIVNLRVHNLLSFIRLTEGINSAIARYLFNSAGAIVCASLRTFFSFVKISSHSCTSSLVTLSCFCSAWFQHNPFLKFHKRQIFPHSFSQRNSTLKTVRRAKLYNFANGLKSVTLPVR